MNGYHRALAVYTVYRCADDSAALVDGEFKFNALLFKIFHGFVYAVAENLFVVSRGNIQATRGLKILGEQLFDCGELREERSLCVYRAASPDFPVRYLAELLMSPVARRGNDIVVRHEQYIPALVAPGDFIDPAVFAEIFYLGALVQQRKQLFDRRAQFRKLRVVIYFAGRYGLTFYHFHQPFAVLDILLLGCIYRLFTYRLGLFRGERGSYEQYTYEYNKNCKHGEKYIKSHIVHPFSFCH